MKYQSVSKEVCLNGVNYGVMANDDYPIYPTIFKSIHGQTEAMASHYSRLLAFRYDIRCSNFEQTNSVMTKFCEKFKRRLNTKAFGYMKRLGYVWVREQKTSENPHYHAVFILNGNNLRCPYRVIDVLEDIAFRLDLPKPFTPENSYAHFHRSEINSPETKEFLKRCSYLAKVNTKGNRPDKTHDYGSSRIQIKKRACDE